MLESRSFDVCKNAAVPMIVMLDYWKLDIEISDTGIETIESDNCRRLLRDNRDTNGVLAMTWERARFSYKDR